MRLSILSLGFQNPLSDRHGVRLDVNVCINVADKAGGQTTDHLEMATVRGG